MALTFPDIIDNEIFDQILEMDDDEEREFSLGIYEDFKSQSMSTLAKMKVLAKLEISNDEKKLIDMSRYEDLSEEARLKELSDGGHFLKGSSATLGLRKVQKGCEKIQHFGQRKDESGEHSNDTNQNLFEKIRTTISEVEQDYKDATKVLDRFYRL